MRLPRALVDANLLVSVLISSDRARSAAAAVFAEANARSISLVVPTEAITELTRVVAIKPWLNARIPRADVDRLVAQLALMAEVAQTLNDPPPRICRDPEDDSLLAQAVMARVDYLITRDRDLLALSAVAGVCIVDPVSFLELLRAESE